LKKVDFFSHLRQKPLTEQQLKELKEQNEIKEMLELTSQRVRLKQKVENQVADGPV